MSRRQNRREIWNYIEDNKWECRVTKSQIDLWLIKGLLDTDTMHALSHMLSRHERVGEFEVNVREANRFLSKCWN